MISIVALAARISGNKPPDPPPRALLSFKRDWAKTVDTIDEKIQDAQSRREALAKERDGQILAAVEGDDVAQQKADQLDGQIDVIDRELHQLSIARGKAAERRDAEEIAKAAKAEKKHLAEIRDTAKTLRECAADVDAQALRLYEALDTFREAGQQLASIAETGEIWSVVGDLNMKVITVVSSQLTPSGYSFGGGTIYEPERRKLVSYTPDPDYIVNAIARAKAKAAA